MQTRRDFIGRSLVGGAAILGTVPILGASARANGRVGVSGWR